MILAGLAAERLVTLAELVRGGAAIPDGPRLFKSTGMSWEDAVIARAVHARVTSLARFAPPWPQTPPSPADRASYADAEPLPFWLDRRPAATTRSRR